MSSPCVLGGTLGTWRVLQDPSAPKGRSRKKQRSPPSMQSLDTLTTAEVAGELAVAPSVEVMAPVLLVGPPHRAGLEGLNSAGGCLLAGFMICLGSHHFLPPWHCLLCHHATGTHLEYVAMGTVAASEGHIPLPARLCEVPVDSKVLSALGRPWSLLSSGHCFRSVLGEAQSQVMSWGNPNLGHVELETPSILCGQSGSDAETAVRGTQRGSKASAVWVGWEAS